MAVAVKNTPEAAAARPMNQLAVASLMGVVYILGSIGIVFYGLPTLWHTLTAGSALADLSFVNYALLAVLMMGAAVLLIYVGTQLATDLPRGWSAGVAVGAAGVILIALLTAGFGALLESAVGLNASVGLPLTAALGAGLLFLLVQRYFRAGFEKGLLALEEQGWFTQAPYKKTQGQRVRRGTLLGVLAIAGTGIWTLMEHKTLEFTNNNWEITLPFADGARLLLLRDVRFTVPMLLTLASLWLAYRLVNFPVFADFLIATEAELNKVSWAPRKRLVQDTIVVLTTVVLVTAFIFVADVVWGRVLTWAGVLQLPPPKVDEMKEAPW